MKHYIKLFTSACLWMLLLSCGNLKKQTAEPTLALQPVGPVFSADSAWWNCEQQCSFGPRTMNSEAHDRCEAWLISRFQHYGLSVATQKALLKGYDGTMLRATNITASYRPEQQNRILLCAHWDSRPWADNDPNDQNHHQPVMGANDGASGVGVMLEVARLLTTDSLSLGVDFVCFDAEDWGLPQWETNSNEDDTFALGAQHWAATIDKSEARKYRFGILLDMVGGQGARFYQEGMSREFAPDVVDKVWQAAQIVGFGSLFPKSLGGYITDDHLPVNRVAKIPCIDMIPYYPDCKQSSFGPTWHTVNDTMEHLDRNTLQAVGQTVVQVLFAEQ